MLHRHERAVFAGQLHLVVEHLSRAREHVLHVPVAVRGELVGDRLAQDGIESLVADERTRHRVEEAVAVALHEDGHQRGHRAAVLRVHRFKKISQVLRRVEVNQAARLAA